jgi:hypothetical protein
MDLYNKFTSNQNKGMVWKLLCDDGIFNNIPANKAAQVKDAFDQKFEILARQITSVDNLVNLDKRIITEMINDVEKFKKSEELTLTYSAAEIAQSRQKVFQDELKNKKKEFDALNSTPVPEKIDFSDNLDTPMGSEMDKILAQQIAMREKQLNMVLKTQDKEAANKWIQNPGDANDLKENIKLKIGEELAKEPIKAKKVVFADTVENDNFMALLKRKEPASTKTSDDSSLDILREILAKQNQILELLKGKN